MSHLPIGSQSGSSDPTENGSLVPNTTFIMLAQYAREPHG